MSATQGTGEPMNRASPVRRTSAVPCVVLLSSSPVNPAGAGAPGNLLLFFSKSTPTSLRTWLPSENAEARPPSGPPPTQVTTVSPDCLPSEPRGLPMELAPRRRIPGGGWGPLQTPRVTHAEGRLPSFLAVPESPVPFSGAPNHFCSRRFRKTFRGYRRGAPRRALRSERSERRR